MPFFRHAVSLALALLAVSSACTGFPDERVGTLPFPWGALHYWITGSTPDTIIVLHGGPGFQHRYLIDPLRPLSARHTLIFYDQRGRGRSDWPADSAEAPTAASDVADLEALRVHFKLERFAVIGHQWGAGLAFLYDLEHPARISRAVMIHPIYPRQGWLYYVAQTAPDAGAVARRVAATRAGVDTANPRQYCLEHWGSYLSPAVVTAPRVVNRIARGMCDAPAESIRRIMSVNTRVLHSVSGWDWLQDLRRFEAPVLIVQGNGRDQPAANDALEQASREWARGLPAARLTIVGESVAFPWIDDPRAFRDALAAFLRALPDSITRFPTPRDA